MTPEEELKQDIDAASQFYSNKFKLPITVENVFKYLLRNKDVHRSQMMSDIQQGYLPARHLNSELISKKVMNDDNPDIGMDHIDAVLGDPTNEAEVPDLEEWQKDAVYEQFDEKTAAKMIRNIEDKTHEQLPDDAETRKLKAQAKDNAHSVVIDRLLTNLYKRQDLNDNDKIEAALRLVFNNATRNWALQPVDIRLDQKFFNDALLLDGTFDKFNETKAKKLGRELKDDERAENMLYNKQRVHADEVPLTYASDKTFDENGKENSVFTTTDKTNTVYDLFASKILKDLANGDDPDPDQLPAYIYKTYADRMKTMSWLEWQNLLDKEEDAINNAREEALGRHLSEAEKVSFEIDDYDDLLTPADWIEFMPENRYKVSGLTQEQRKENRLHRQHGTGKQLEKYKEFTDYVAQSLDPNSDAAFLNDMKKTELKANIKQHMHSELPDLETLYDYYDDIDDEEGKEEIAKKIQLRIQVLNDTDIGKNALDNIVHNLTVRRLRNDFEVPSNEVVPVRSAKQQRITDEMAEEQALKEAYELMQNGTPAEKAMYAPIFAELQNAKAQQAARYKAAKGMAEATAKAEINKLKNRRQKTGVDSHGFDIIENLEREMDEGIDE